MPASSPASSSAPVMRGQPPTFATSVPVFEEDDLLCLGEKDLALVDADESSVVDGWAYQVKDRAEEDSLRVYETGMYEVVRCTVEVMGEKEGVVHGLTFRLAKGI